MESHKYICVREPDRRSLVIIDPANPSRISNLARKPMNADSAIMNPQNNVIALRAGNQLHVYDMDQKSRIQECQLYDPVLFWKWINDKTIGIVTANSVYHWTLGTSDPVKIFARHDSLNDCQIVDYCADNSLKWLCVTGIAEREGLTVGAMQLHSIDRKVSQIIAGHVCIFTDFTLEGANKSSILFAFANRSATDAKLYIIEVGKPDDSPGYQKKMTDLYLPTEVADFPVTMKISEKYNIIYIVTKYGYIYIYDLYTASLIYKNRISTESIFVTVSHPPSGGILGVDRKGNVLLVTINEDTIRYCAITNPEIAMKLASKGDLLGADDLFIYQFNKLLQQKLYKEAAKVVMETPRNILRTQKTIQLFRQSPTISDQLSPLLQYFQVLLENGKLNKIETLELVKLVVQQGRIQLVEKWISDEKLECSEELGDLVQPYDSKLALSIYQRAQIIPNYFGVTNMVTNIENAPLLANNFEDSIHDKLKIDENDINQSLKSEINSLKMQNMQSEATISLLRAELNNVLKSLAEMKKEAPKEDYNIDITCLTVDKKKILGKGSFGDVYLGTYYKMPVAIKELRTGSLKAIEDFKNEVQILMKLKYSHIVTCFGCVTSPEPIIILEYMSNGTLHNWIYSNRRAAFDLTFVDRILLEISLGMHYLHAQKPMIIHRDLKSLNVLLDKNLNVKIADFGLAKTKSHGQSNTDINMMGTIPWTAPEYLTISRKNERTEKGDVFSFGVIVWELVTKETPWEREISKNDIVQTVLAGERLEIPSHCPQHLKQIMTMCWNNDPTQRPSFDVLTQIFSQQENKGKKILDSILSTEEELELDRLKRILKQQLS